MDRQRTEMLFTEAERLRTTLVEASSRLASFTKQLRDVLEDEPEETDKENPDEQ